MSAVAREFIEGNGVSRVVGLPHGQMAPTSAIYGELLKAVRDIY
jgi:hypothetical protein